MKQEIKNSFGKIKAKSSFPVFFIPNIINNVFLR